MIIILQLFSNADSKNASRSLSLTNSSRRSQCRTHFILTPFEIPCCARHTHSFPVHSFIRSFRALPRVAWYSLVIGDNCPKMIRPETTLELDRVFFETKALSLPILFLCLDISVGVRYNPPHSENSLISMQYCKNVGNYAGHRCVQGSFRLSP